MLDTDSDGELQIYELAEFYKSLDVNSDNRISHGEIDSYFSENYPAVASFFYDRIRRAVNKLNWETLV